MSRLEEALRYSEAFLDFLRNFKDESGRLKYMDRIRRMIMFNRSSLIIDYPDLYRYDPSLAQAVIDDPDNFLREAGEAIKELVVQENPGFAERKKKFTPRFVNLYETVRIRDLKSEYIGKMVQIEGIITRMLPVKSKLVKAMFRHSKCRAEFLWPESEEESIGERLEKPPICPVCGESGGSFTLVKEKSVFIDYQRVVVQEKPEDVPGGQMPRSVEVQLTEDLVDTARPGDRVAIVGIVRIEQPSPRSPLFDIYVSANSIRVSEKELEEVSITREDEERIKELARDPWIKERIIASIAPSIYGHWDLKEAIALLLFGGVPKVKPDGTRIRGDIHVLFIGDPGMAKSQLLQAAARIAPRAVLTSGKGSTAAGLTAAVLRDSRTGEYYLEAGALVLADGGVAVIDEIDKMRNEDRVAIHEAMEQQSYHKDFELMLADGRKVRIGEFVDSLIERNKDRVIRGKETEILLVDDVYLLGYDLKGKRVVPIKADRVSRHKAPKEFIKIKFSNGREIIVTPEHPIMIWENGQIVEKPASEVKEGQLAVGVRQYNIVSDKLDPHLAKLAGFLASEGFTYANPTNGYYEIGFSNTNRSLVEEFKSILDSLKVSYNISKRERQGLRNLYTVRVISKSFYYKLKKLFPELFPENDSERPAKRRRVPARIMRADTEAKKAFINAYFKGDGFVDKYRVGIVTSSKSMAEDLQDLLLDLGIYTYISEENRLGRHYYKVIVSGTDDMARFLEIVCDDRRAEKIKALIEKSRNKRNYRDIIPLEIADKLRKILRELRISDGRLTNNISRGFNANRQTLIDYIRKAETEIRKIKAGIKQDNIDLARRIVSIKELSALTGAPYSTLYYQLVSKRHPGLAEKILSLARRRIGMLEAELESIKNLVEGNIRFLRIKKVERIKNNDSEWVYDVTVEPYHLFVSHGLVLHNTISISKAGIVARLNARASVLAAGNPKFGLYDPNKPFVDNVNLPPTILSRFDLIFVLRDIPEKRRDLEMARYILETNINLERAKPDIDPQTLKKYIIYAKRYVRPRISEKAKELLVEFFTTMRANVLSKLNRQEGESASVLPIPITARQLEALVRLTEAYARMSLKEEATEEEAAEAIRLTLSFLRSVGFDIEAGVIDVSSIMAGATLSTRRAMSAILDIIKRLEREKNRCVWLNEILKEAEKLNIKEEKAREAISKMHKEGLIYEIRTDCFRAA